jgi:hypothetical protein
MTVVHVPPDKATEIARSLLQAAQELGLDPTTTVKTSSDGVFGLSFVVPDEVYLRANGVSRADVDEVDAEPEPEPTPKKRGRPKKAAAAATEPVVEEE